jgi:hypothetical protein
MKNKETLSTNSPKNSQMCEQCEIIGLYKRLIASQKQELKRANEEVREAWTENGRLTQRLIFAERGILSSAESQTVIDLREDLANALSMLKRNTILVNLN